MRGCCVWEMCRIGVCGRRECCEGFVRRRRGWCGLAVCGRERLRCCVLEEGGKNGRETVWEDCVVEEEKPEGSSVLEEIDKVFALVVCVGGVSDST